jgi:hypothetical protein
MINVAFLKNNIAMDILIFDEANDNEALIASIVTDKGYDSSIECDPNTSRYSTWNGVEFTETPQEILGELGVINYVKPTEPTD